MLTAVVCWLGGGGVDGRCRGCSVRGEGFLRWCSVPETFDHLLLVCFIFSKLSGMRNINILTFVAANLKTKMK